MNDDVAVAVPQGEPIAEGSLRGFKLFDGLPDTVADAFSHAAHWRRYQADEMIFDQASDTLEVHFVFSGRVRLLSCVDGAEAVTLAEVQAGEVFGELAAIDGMPRSARAAVVSDAVVASIEGPVFVQLMERHPTTAVRMMRRLTRIVRSMDVRLVNMSSLDPAQRVMVELIRIAEPDARVPGSWIIPFSPSHSEIAGWASVDKDLVARTIGEMARDGILRRRGGSIVFLNWQKLQLLAKPKSGRDWNERPQGVREDAAPPAQPDEPMAAMDG